MAKKLDPVIADVLKGFGFGADAAWDCHGTWVVYHRVLEQIAAKAGILYREPTVLVAEKDAAAILVTGQLGDKAEWSIGEAVIGTNYKVSGKQAAYPFAMAEKRAKDRVILKLIGLHGLAYSEEEADDFRAPSSVGTERRGPDPEVAGSSPAERTILPASIEPNEDFQQRIADTLIAAVNTADGSYELADWLGVEDTRRTISDLPADLAGWVWQAIADKLIRHLKMTETASAVTGWGENEKTKRTIADLPKDQADRVRVAYTAHRAALTKKAA